MSYAGEYSDKPSRCRPEDHQWSFNQHCHTCGVSRAGLIDEAKRILKLAEDGQLGEDCA